MKKPFDQNLYDADDPAKQQILDWLTSQGFNGEINPDQYGIDIIGDFGGEPFAAEVEVKHNWVGERFPFKTVHFSARKLKFLDRPVNTCFMMLNHERTHVLIVGKPYLQSAIIVTKDTIYTTEEQFIEVPLAYCSIESLESKQDDNRTQRRIF